MRRSIQSRGLLNIPMGYAYKISKTMMPKISPTERAALNAGTGEKNEYTWVKFTQGVHMNRQ